MPRFVLRRRLCLCEASAKQGVMAQATKGFGNQRWMAQGAAGGAGDDGEYYPPDFFYKFINRNLALHVESQRETFHPQNTYCDVCSG